MIAGIRVGHATDPIGVTGVTVVLTDQPAVAGIALRGGANDVVGLDHLDSGHLVGTVNGVVLGGGSRFGEEAVYGVMRWLEERGGGFLVGAAARAPERGPVTAGPGEPPDTRRLTDSARAIAAGAGRFEGPRHTPIGVVTTNARLTKIEAAKVPSLAMVGFGRALSPPHTAFDGDSLFVLSVGDLPFDLTRVGVLAADAVARAIARGVRAATSLRDIPAARDLAAI